MRAWNGSKCAPQRAIILFLALSVLVACSAPDEKASSSGSTDDAALNAGPRQAAPEGLFGKKWRSRPTRDIKLYASPGDGVTIYTPTGPPPAFEAIPVAEADLEYDKGRLWRGDVYIDGAGSHDAVKKALLKLYGAPDSLPSTGNDYSWSWPDQRVAVDMRFDSQHGRTTVAFSSNTKDRSTADVATVAAEAGLTPPSDMDTLRSDDMAKVAHNMKLAIMDGDRKEACSNAKSLYYDGRNLAESGSINTAQKNAMIMADRFVKDQCPR